MKFIGRQEELRRLQLLLDDPTERWISVLGLAGVGKSRFVAQALEIRGGGLSKEGHRTGLLLSLSEESYEGRLEQGLVRSAQVASGKHSSSAEEVFTCASLLRIDNAELLTPAEVGWLEEVLCKFPHLRVLATTRIATGAAGEHRFHLQSLAVPDKHASERTIQDSPAVTFLSAALAVQGGRPPDMQHLAAIVRELGGLPLALLLFAPTLATFGGAEALKLLRGEEPLFERVGDSHHPAASAWQAAPASVREGIQVLSTFEGSFTVDFARQLLPEPVYSLIEGLRVRSLIEVDPTVAGRFRLHPLVRKYAQRRVSPAEREARVARIDHYVLDRLVAGLESDPTTIVEWARTEMEALRGCVVRGMETSDPIQLAKVGVAACALFAVDLPPPELDGFVERLTAEEVLGALGPQGDCVLSRYIGLSKLKNLDPSGTDWLQRSQRIADSLPDAPGKAVLSWGTALQRCHRFLEERDVAAATQAASRMRALLVDFEADPSRVGLTIAMETLVRRGEADPCWQFAKLEESREAVRQGGAAQNVAWVDTRIAELAFDVGHLEKARVYAQRAMDSTSRENPLHTFCWAVTLMVSDVEWASEALPLLDRQLVQHDHTAQLWDVGLAHLVVSLRKRDKVLARVQAERLFRLVPEREAGLRHILTVGTALLLGLEEERLMGRRMLDEAGSSPVAEPLIHQFTDAVRVWFQGRTDALTFPLRPTTSPFEAGLMRCFADIAGDGARTPTLRVGLDVSWVALPNQPPVTLSNRPALRRLMRVLLEAHEDGHVLTTDQLFERGWPEESIRPESARNRVRVGLSRLRKAGFDGWLERTGEGIRLSSILRVEYQRP